MKESFSILCRFIVKSGEALWIKEKRSKKYFINGLMDERVDVS